jgi:hypothetical protein
MSSALRQIAPEVGELTTKQKRAAWLVAEDEKSLNEIALECAIAPRTLDYWIRKPAFAARVQEVRAELAANLSRYRIARKDRRVAALQDRWDRQHRIIAERAENPEMQNVDGGSTGMMVRTLKVVGAGEFAQLVEEYGYDTGLDAAMRATEMQAAKESGQWTEKSDIPSDGAAFPPAIVQIIELPAKKEPRTLEPPDSARTDPSA